MPGILSKEIKTYIDKCVLCWLATSSKENNPNVSPKEIFTYLDDENILIANIASPQSAKNIIENPKVCISFIDILIQKGFQLKGTAQIINKEDAVYNEFLKKIHSLSEDRFPLISIIKIKIEKAKTILAPSYILNPQTSEEDQVKKAITSYQLNTQNRG